MDSDTDRQLDLIASDENDIGAAVGQFASELRVHSGQLLRTPRLLSCH